MHTWSERGVWPAGQMIRIDMLSAGNTKLVSDVQYDIRQDARLSMQRSA